MDAVIGAIEIPLTALEEEVNPLAFLNALGIADTYNYPLCPKK